MDGHAGTMNFGSIAVRRALDEVMEHRNALGCLLSLFSGWLRAMYIVLQDSQVVGLHDRAGTVGRAWVLCHYSLSIIHTTGIVTSSIGLRS
jgi:hypothetical protein